MKRRLFVIAMLGLSACARTPNNIDGAQVYFAFDSAEVTAAAREDLRGQANYMKKNPGTNITLQGRCDERGSTDYNLALGALRAGNAAHVLMGAGIEPARVKTISYGKENPIYKGTGEKIWALNRNATTVVQEQTETQE